MMKRYALLLILIVSMLMITHNIQPLNANSPVIRYVSTTGVDKGDCTSPVEPCRTIQYAVNQSSSGDTILVAQGTYTYTGSNQCSFLRTQPVVCIIDKSLTIRGGYSNWTHPDPIRNPTVIDGGNSYRGVAVIGYNERNTYLEMTGFTIQNCHVHGPTYSQADDFFSIGGGMLSLHASVILRDVVFRNNKIYGPSTNTGIGGAAYGAALYIYKPSPESVSSIKRVIFEANESYGGNGRDRGGVAFGALFVDNAKVVVEDSIFTRNVVQAGNASGSGESGNPPKADALGGGIGIQDSDIILRRVTITNNRVIGGNAQQYGGGAYGGGIFIEDLSDTTPAVQVHISDSYLAGNIAVGGSGAADGGVAVGGGICAANSIVTIERTQVISNAARGGNANTGNAGLGVGGGIYTSAIRRNTGALTVLRNVIVADNLADQGIGNMRLDSGGGGVAIHGMQADLIHTTFAQNRLGNHLFLAQALLVQPWPDPLLPAVVTLTRSIIADHTLGASSATAVVVEQGSTLGLDGVIFANNNHNINTNAVPVRPGIIKGLETTVTVSSAGFISPGYPNHNYHLRLGSPALDLSGQTIVSDDIDRENRPYGSKSDFGADEYHPFRLTFVPGDAVIRLDWSAGSGVLQGGVGHYMLHLVSCEEGASPPQEVGCGQSVNVGTATTFTLTGLTNFKHYVVQIYAYDPTGNLIATSEQVVAFPTTIFVFLPLVLK